MGTTNGNDAKKKRTPVEELSAAEREIRAMKKIGAALEALPAPARQRVLGWAADHYGIGSQVVRELESTLEKASMR